MTGLQAKNTENSSTRRPKALARPVCAKLARSAMALLLSN